jgi:hypothetical protein
MLPQGTEIASDLSPHKSDFTHGPRAGRGEHKAKICYAIFVTEERKFTLLFAATILAARKLAELEARLGDRPCPAREVVIADAVSKATEILRRIDGLYPSGR